MLKQPQPSIRRLIDPIIPVHRNPFSEVVSGPISPLERNPQSPMGWKNRESDGIGLGIVVTLEKSDGRKGPENLFMGTPIKCVSSPISIGCPKDELGCNWRCYGNGTRLDVHEPKDCRPFYGAPMKVMADLRAFRPADFLSHCCLCRKKLHGKDIYMYRGEKAFCSTECRYQQIVSDEFQEKCGPEALRSSEITRSPYADDRLFFMGITAS